jgi:hypothetical protein
MEGLDSEVRYCLVDVKRIVVAEVEQAAGDIALEVALLSQQLALAAGSVVRVVQTPVVQMHKESGFVEMARISLGLELMLAQVRIEVRFDCKLAAFVVQGLNTALGLIVEPAARQGVLLVVTLGTEQVLG